MIDVRISRNSEGMINSFIVSGHSGYAEEGHDIVCAAVSTAVQSVALGADEVIGADNCKTAMKDAYFEWKCPEGLDKETQSKLRVLTETAYLVIGQLQEQYPGYLRISGYLRKE